MSDLRKEKDSLGFVEVPSQAYYGAQTARAVANFPISGMRTHSPLIRALGMVKRAAAEANKELGLVDEKRAGAVIQAAQEVIDGQWDTEFMVDVFQAGAGVSLHMNTNEVIANRANEILGGKLGEYAHVHPNDHVNYGQSTNDVFPTAMHLGDGSKQPPTFGHVAEERAAFDPQRFFTGFKLHLGRPDTGKDAFLMTKYFLGYLRRRVAAIVKDSAGGERLGWSVN